MTATDVTATAGSTRVSVRRLLSLFGPGNRAGMVALLFILVGMLAAFMAPYWVPLDPNVQNLRARLLPPLGFAGADPRHWLGTDPLGRDLFSRAVYGARISFAIGLTAATVSGVLGTGLGILAAYRGKIVETVIMRLVDVQTAFPFLIVAISIVAVFGANLRTLIVVLIIWQWVPFARLAHAKTLTVKKADYFAAAIAVGRRDIGIAVRHVVPNVAAPLVVVWTFIVARSIIAESALSFLGLGIPPPTPTWGGMLSASRGYLDTAWWIPLVPGAAIVAVVLAVNVMGDWLNDKWDPHGRG